MIVPDNGDYERRTDVDFALAIEDTGADRLQHVLMAIDNKANLIGNYLKKPTLNDMNLFALKGLLLLGISHIGEN